MLLTYGLVGLLTVGLIAWIANRTIKKDLSKRLGRKVKDHEVTSLSAWMKADDNK